MTTPVARLQMMRKFLTKIRDAKGWRLHVIAMLAGAASVLSMAPLFAWPVMFITIPVFVLLLDGTIARAENGKPGRRAWNAAVVGWFFGFGYFLASLFWIGEAFLVEADKFAWALPFAVTLLPAGLAFYFALASAAAALIWRPGIYRLLALALTLTVTEWLRGQLFTGFPWNLLGYSLTGNESMMQWAAFFGAYGLTPLAILIFASPVPLIDHVLKQDETGLPGAGRLILPGAALAAFLIGMPVGNARFSAPPLNPVDGVKLRLVQPNIPQKDKWLPQNRQQVFNRLMQVTSGRSGPADTALTNVTHVIWPESAFPFLILRSRQSLDAIAALLPGNTVLITGALRMQESPSPGAAPGSLIKRRVFNSLLALDTDGRTLAVYDKMHLVPFGEFLPFQNFLEAIGLEQLTRLKGGFASGGAGQKFTIKGLPRTVPLICYEIIFPGKFINGDKRPAWLLNLTNDAWFGRTSGPHQHFHQARIRAIEEGVPLVRVANTGISAVIDPYGRILNRIPLMSTGAVNSHLPSALPPTTYAMYRESILFFEILSILIAMFLVARGRTGEI